MINSDDYTNGNRTEHNSNWSYIPDHPYRILIVGVMMICRLVHVTSQRYKVLEKGGWLRHTLDLSLAPDRPLRGRSVRSPQIQGVSEPTPLF